nr:MAG TPA: hypothetical protein [Caudoviricetes sp.]DAR29230.1 MAG TPA: hypothetical protein [Caudoviricetes sp.]
MHKINSFNKQKHIEKLSESLYFSLCNRFTSYLVAYIIQSTKNKRLEKRFNVWSK